MSNLLIGLQSWYDLEDARDSVSGRDLTNANGVSFEPGKKDDAAKFSAGSNQSLCYDYPILAGGKNAFTIAGWVKADTTERWRMIYVGDGTFLYRDYGNAITWTVYDGTYRSLALNAAPTGDWMFVVLRYRPNVGEHGQFKFDLRHGEEASSTTYSAIAEPEHLRRCYFGWANDVDARGQVDSVGLWSRMLTDAEIGLLWNGGCGVSYADISA